MDLDKITDLVGIRDESFPDALLGKTGKALESLGGPLARDGEEFDE